MIEIRDAPCITPNPVNGSVSNGREGHARFAGCRITGRTAGGMIRESALWGIAVKDGQWPSDQTHDTAFAWPAHEPKYESYTGWTPVQVILNEHFQDLTKAQDAVFWLLVNDISEVRDEQFSDDRTV
jgi:hypothetical protein